MRITFILPDANFLGGTRVIAIYAERLRRRGHQVYVVSTPRRPIPIKQRFRSLVDGRGWPSAESRPASYLDATGVDHRVIDRWRPMTDADVPDADVVIATWWETAHWVAGFSPRKGAKAYFVQDYGAHGGQPLDKVAETWRLPLHKITICRWLRDLVVEHCAGSEIDLVLNSVDQEQFQAPRRGKQPAPTVGTVYSRRPQKGCDTALAAVRLAREQIPALKLITFGGGPPSEDLPLPPGTVHNGHAREDELATIYAGCDAWLFSSRKEGFGLPILEAMACRTPVIATPAGAAPELLEGGRGLLVNMDDPADMARAIVEICRMDEATWEAMSDAAFEATRAYSWDDATDRFEAALLSATRMTAAT